MAENIISIEGQDNNKIYALHNNEGNKKLVLHLHGMTHAPQFLLEVTSSEFFVAKGYDHCRPDFYASPEDSRHLENSSLSTHIKDIKSVLHHFKDAYDEIFVTAHSLSGLAMIIANPKGIKAMSLWDPSTDVTNFWKSGPYLTPIPERKQYHLNYGRTFAISEEMVDEIKHYPDEHCQKLASQIKTPTQFVIPEESIFLASPHTSPEVYKDKFKGPFELQRIDTANHGFSKPGNREPLFQKTLQFFNKNDLN